MCLLFVCSLYRNQIGDEGAVAIAKSLEVNAVLTDLNLAYNNLCGIDSFSGQGTYTAVGITAITEALKFNAVMTSIVFEGAPLPVKQLKGTEPVKTLDLYSRRLGPLSAIVIGSLIAVNAVLTELK